MATEAQIAAAAQARAVQTRRKYERWTQELRQHGYGITEPGTTGIPAGTPLSLTTIHRMQGLINDLASYDLDRDIPADVVYMTRLEAASIRRAAEAEYEASETVDITQDKEQP